MGHRERSSLCFPELIIGNTGNQFFRILELQTRWKLILKRLLGDKKEKLGQPAGLECFPESFQTKTNTNLQNDPEEQMNPILGAAWDSGR